MAFGVLGASRPSALSPVERVRSTGPANALSQPSLVGKAAPGKRGWSQLTAMFMTARVSLTTDSDFGRNLRDNIRKSGFRNRLVGYFLVWTRSACPSSAFAGTIAGKQWKQRKL